MNALKRLQILRASIALLLIFGLCAGHFFSNSVRAQSGQGLAKKPKQEKADKVSRELRDKTRGAKGSDKISVIVQFDDVGDLLSDSILQGNGGKVKNHFRNLKTSAVEIPASALEAIAAHKNVRFVSLDSDIRSLSGHVSLTTGTDAVRDQTNVLGQGYTLDGKGIGIAILDSGIDKNHVSFQDSSAKSRVVYSRDFTGENRTDDPNGHGTHVAGDAAANGAISKGKYIGLAPCANLINLRVLDSDGVGKSSSLLAALDWVLANRTLYNIRVVNMSLGALAVDSYLDDPLCKAVRRLVDAGVVVVAAAGNNGKDEFGNKLYGHIHSPGNEPSAITVGATDTKGTIDRSDDGVTTYSSRGPTRSFWVDTAGIRHYDNLIKPDLVAPGNKLISSQSPNNKLVTENPGLDVNVSNNPERDMMRLSGSSMATPVVAGAAALLLQANPNLTPNLVKAILMYTAQPLAGFNHFEQGAGQLNVEGAVRLAKLVRTNLTATTTVGSPLLTTSVAPVPQTTISYTLNGLPKSTTFPWSQGIILDQTYATGINLILKYQGVYASGALLSDGSVLTDGALLSDGTLLSSGITIGSNILVLSGVSLSTGPIYMGVGTLLSEGTILVDGTFLADGTIFSDSTIMSDGTLLSSSILQSYAALLGGDNTLGMEVEPDVP